jgi:hypothetical protein
MPPRRALFKRSGRIEPADLAMVLVAEMETTDRELRQNDIIEKLKTYPQEHEAFRRRADQLIRNIDRLKDIL